MDYQTHHHHLKAQRQYLANQQRVNEHVELIKPEYGLSDKRKNNGQWTPAIFGTYNVPDKRLSLL
jgi:hypothetical protein